MVPPAKSGTIMTPTTITADPSRASDFRVITLVGAAHFVSHVYILALPPLFVFLRADFGVSYVELGWAIALFNVLTGTLQTPAGFLADRISARAVLVGGIVLGAASLLLAAYASSFALFVVAVGLLGLGNTVYHPADYALLSSRISAQRMSQAYSIHIFAGFTGTAVAPALMIALAQTIGWRAGLVAIAIMGFVVAAAIMLFGEVLAGRSSARASGSATDTRTDWRLFTSAPVLLNLIFFMLLAMVATGVGSYGIVALEVQWNTSLSLATTALTAYLGMSALAVLVGGMVSARTDRHDIVATAGLALSAITLIPIAFVDLGAAFLVAMLGISGFFNGFIQPSRDMLVRSVTPPGAFGKVFGFITTGFNIGGMIAPPMFGYMMDHGSPRGVLIGSAVCALIAIPTVLITVSQGAKKTPHQG